MNGTQSIDGTRSMNEHQLNEILIYGNHCTQMSDPWKIYMHNFTVAHKNPTIMKVWRERNLLQWNKYIDFFSDLQ